MYPSVNGITRKLLRKLITILLLAIGLLISTTVAITAFASEINALNDAQQVVVESWKLVNQGYLDPKRLDEIRWKRLRQKALEKQIKSSNEAYDAIEEMLSLIDDPYTRHLRPNKYKALKDSTNGNLSGVGLQLGPGKNINEITIISALDGSPAAEAELVSGTELLAVDGNDIQELGLQDAASALRGDVGSQVILTVKRPGHAAEEITLERRNIDLRPVRSRRLRSDSHTLGYLRITQFTEGVQEQVRSALDELKEKDIEALVLDLRNNSGGLVSSGLAIADDFLSGQTIVETRNREGINEIIKSNKETLFDKPMVTLVNGGTASASEILAAALKDNSRSYLMGSQTFGKGLIQTLTNLSDGSGLAITVAKYITPSGNTIQGKGIIPEKILDTPEPPNPGGDSDRWLTEAENFMESQLEIGSAPDLSEEVELFETVDESFLVEAQ